ncbi:glyoxalase [bacterium]|mgnify:FL=1|jgi:methylmalonyl-CoA/ethylmalonyl-CoA epimerase|nr:glyoxalase [bacterium]
MIFDHIGLFVHDIEEGRESLRKLFPISKVEDVVDDYYLGVSVQFCIDSSGVRYELVAPLTKKNPVSGVLDTGKNILNHVAYLVDDIKIESERLRKEGCIQLTKISKSKAFKGNMIVFFLTPMRFIIELIESGKND